jgi:hypothetical protein
MLSQVVTLPERPSQGLANNPSIHAPITGRYVSFHSRVIPALFRPLARPLEYVSRLVRGYPGPLVISAGFYGSSSTWAFNAIARLLLCHKSREGCRVYADELENCLKQFRENPWTVVKTHNPSPDMLATIRLAHAPVVITVRDPRDCVVSMMERFAWSFEQSLDGVANGAARLSELLANRPAPLILKYENANGNRAAALQSIKSYLALKVTPREMAAIQASLSPASVKCQIAALEKSGVFGSAAADLAHDPQTLWHPRHVGDGVSGKYLQRLTPPQAAEVWGRTHRHCQEFGLL